MQMLLKQRIGVHMVTPPPVGQRSIVTSVSLRVLVFVSLSVGTQAYRWKYMPDIRQILCKCYL